MVAIREPDSKKAQRKLYIYIYIYIYAFICTGAGKERGGVNRVEHDRRTGRLTVYLINGRFKTWLHVEVSFKQDTAPDEQLVPCMAAFAISVCMSV